MPETKEEPVYKVFMPPRFDASATVQPGSDPKLILLVREAAKELAGILNSKANVALSSRRRNSPSFEGMKTLTLLD